MISSVPLLSPFTSNPVGLDTSSPTGAGESTYDYTAESVSPLMSMTPPNLQPTPGETTPWGQSTTGPPPGQSTPGEITTRGLTTPGDFTPPGQSTPQAPPPQSPIQPERATTPNNDPAASTPKINPGGTPHTTPHQTDPNSSPGTTPQVVTPAPPGPPTGGGNPQPEPSGSNMCPYIPSSWYTTSPSGIFAEPQTVVFPYGCTPMVSAF